MHYIIENNQVVCSVADLVLHRSSLNGRQITTATFSCNEIRLLSARELDLASRNGEIIFVLVKGSFLNGGVVTFDCIVTEQAQDDQEQAAAVIDEYES